MKPSIKTITSILFILLGFSPMLFMFFLTVKQRSIHHRMKERMEEQILVTITLADNEIHWVKQGKEILVQNQMFDIKLIEHKNGLTIFHGLFDQEETNLNKYFQESWKKKLSEQNQLIAQLFQCLQGFDFNPASDCLFFSSKKNTTASFNSPKLQSQFKIILTPPPQV